MPDGKAIRSGRLEDMVSRNQASSSLHILNDNGGVSRYVLAQMARDEARISVVATSRRKADDDADGFPLPCDLGNGSRPVVRVTIFSTLCLVGKGRDRSLQESLRNHTGFSTPLFLATTVSALEPGTLTPTSDLE